MCRSQQWKFRKISSWNISGVVSIADIKLLSPAETITNVDDEIFCMKP